MDRCRTTDNDDNNAPLPSYLARHVPLGFDSDDVATLINAIDSSQMRGSQSTPTPPHLPHLPAEILLHILDHIPIHYLLDWRRVCRGFRDAIDGPVLYQHLQRTELIGYIGPQRTDSRNLSDEDYQQLYLLRARFLCVIDDNGTRPRDPKQAGVKWSSRYATFNNEDGWFQKLEELSRHDAQLKQGILGDLNPISAFHEFGTLQWCIKLDNAVLDVELPIQKEGLYLALNSESGVRIRLLWRDALLALLKSEAKMRKMLEDKKDCEFTFTLQEDCLRAVRRQRLRAALNQDDKEDRRTRWALGLLRPLFGKIRYDKAGHPWDLLERTEEKAMVMLKMLRREASLTAEELTHLKQLANDRATMAEELESMNELFATWKENLYSPVLRATTVAILSTERMPDMNANPLFWSDEMIYVEENRVRKWITQRKVVEQLVALLKSSNEALEAPEDAFDDLGSEI
ncbi:hypothetical protein K504DRAFT_392336 [Pleomassaria siparia CBS 279.74]|uniref:F-box domain-containing protein n=1 Tax=Pleomassaria siparia CBS 279.74 TaxID=1314801 RepID=A0A6G1JSL7_9PLEO|nr:hypothetical protein K504DRAFT_392336 [Pleomassaria siparia CBS 279.74]